MYTFLIVDDENIEKRGIRMLLSKLGIDGKLLEANNGEEAMEILRRQKVDILLTDISMPFMDGLELLKRVKQEFPSMYSVIFSGYDEFAYAKQAIDYGVSAYILKPVDPQEFEKVIRELTKKLDRAQEGDEEFEKHMEEAQIAEQLQDAGWKVKQVVQYIRQNYADSSMGVDRLADEVQVTPNYLSNIFKKETGENLGCYIRNFRMKKAKQMLARTNYRISDISAQCGFTNPSYFCQNFKETFGISPQKYRNRDNIAESGLGD